MKHILALTNEIGLPKKAGLFSDNEQLCDTLRGISDFLADEAGCPQSKKDEILAILFS